jgi:hypothetical protein
MLDEVYSIQHYAIKFVSELQEVGGFSPVSSINKTDSHNITEILLKVALNEYTSSNIIRTHNGSGDRH